MAVAQVSSLYTSITSHLSPSLSLSRIGATSFATIRIGTSFATVIQRNTNENKLAYKTRSVSIRCEQSTKGNGLDVWLGRLAMVGFTVAITIEIATGKGILENFGLTTPLPTAALAVTGFAGVLAAVFIFQSSSEN